MDILNQKISNKILVLVVSILALLALVVSTTYSLIYNTKKLSNNNYTTGILDISYSVGEELEISNYIPMDDIQGMGTEPYTITISNNGTVSYKFDLNILSTTIDVSNIINAKYIKIQVDDNDPQKLSDLNNGRLYTGLVLNSGEDIEIKIRMWLDENTPNTEIGHLYSAKLVTTGLAVINTKSFNSKSVGYQTLVKLGLDGHIIGDNNSEILEIENNDEYLYFFTGNVDYNYVLFNNKYYRLYAVDGAGNLKIIYAGNSAYVNDYDDSIKKDTIIGESVFNEESNKNIFVGYTYFDSDNFSVIDSNIKLIIEKWYEDNIKNTDYEKYIVNSIYCDDRSIENDLIYYSYSRIVEDNKYSFSCGVEDSYTNDNELGNGYLKYPVGLPTADELLVVGNKYLSNNLAFWTMTPSKYENDEYYMFSYFDELISSKVNDVLGVRPVLTIKADDLVGDGTIKNPFTY